MRGRGIRTTTIEHSIDLLSRGRTFCLRRRCYAQRESVSVHSVYLKQNTLSVNVSLLLSAWTGLTSVQGKFYERDCASKNRHDNWDCSD